MVDEAAEEHSGGELAPGHLLVCGGCGFIGSNFVHHLLAADPSCKATVADALTYAGSTENIEPHLSSGRVTFVQLDIGDPQQLGKLKQFRFSHVVNFAAETHVDRSLYHADRFVRSNVLGTQNLLSFCREVETPYLHISTDEVYGPASEGECFSETAPLNPTSPYAASKAAADLLVLAAIRSHRQQAAIVRTCNNYGPRQYPEKVIPYFLHLILKQQSLPLYGDGLQRRSWLYVEDFCAALLPLLGDFPSGETINIGSQLECTNLELVKLLLRQSGGKSEIRHISDRPAHDRRYALDSAKYQSLYGNLPTRELDAGLKETVDWYQANLVIFERLQEQESVEFRKRHYGSR